MIDQQIERLARLVNQMVEAGRIQAARLPLECERTDLVALVKESVERARARASGHDLTLTAPAEMWACLDPFRVEQVMNNLLENAIKFSPRDGRIEVEVGSVPPSGVRVTVRDHGIGVAPEYRSRLFERFFQAEHESRQGGMGLGLYICHEIVTQHGGEIHAEFPPDGGTRMVVTLPVEPKACHGDGDGVPRRDP